MTHYFDERRANPAQYYATPQSVLSDHKLSAADKEMVLQSMIADIEHKIEAAAEGMPEPQRATVARDLQKALKALTDVRQQSSQNKATLSHPRFRRILAIMTRSEDLNRSVAGVARDLAEACGGKTRWLSVDRPSVSPVHFPGPAGVGAMMPAVDEVDRQAVIERREQHLLTFKAEEFPHADIEIEVKDGDIEVEILNHADDWNADIIVLGAPNRSWLEAVFLPDAAQSVTKAAACPVMVVPEPRSGTA